MEQHSQQGKNVFYPTIKEFITNEQTNTLEGLLRIKAKLDADSSYALTAKELSIVGAISYFVGIDYVQQPYLIKKVAENVQARFSDIKLSEEIIDAYLEIIPLVTDNIKNAFDELQSKAEKTIVFASDSDAVHFKTFIKPTIKKIINNSLVTCESALIIDTILSKKDWSYNDIMTFNSIIINQCEFSGSLALSAYGDLYQDGRFIDLLQKSIKKFDMKKFAVIYFDTILSITESKFDKKYIKIFATGKFADIDFDVFKAEFEEACATEKTEATEQETESEVEAIDPELMEKNPLVFIQTQIIKEQIGKNPETAEDILKGWDMLFANEDLLQHIVNYCKQKSISNSKTKDIQIDIESDENTYLLKETLEAIGNIVVDISTKYKSNSERICSKIPVDKLHKVKEMLRLTIAGTLLTTVEQKQYLISEYFDSSVETYMQLTQVLGLVESSKLIGSEIYSYVNLNKLITADEEMNEIFKNGVSQNQDLQMSMQAYSIILDFYKSFVKK